VASVAGGIHQDDAGSVGGGRRARGAPGRVSVETVLGEFNKLPAVRTIGLTPMNSSASCKGCGPLAG
jgi:hypothetical protein